MGWRSCLLASLALAAAVAVLVPAPASAAQPRRAILAFYGANPQDVLVAPPEGGPLVDSLLESLGREPGLRVGLWSSALGRYETQQVLLDITQGTRQPAGLYTRVDEDGDDEPDPLRLDAATRTFENWQPFRAIARDVSQTLRPGLLAASVPGGAAFVGATDASLLPAIAAADERGRIGALSIGAVGTLASRASRLARSNRLVVVSAPAGRAGLAQLTELARDRDPDELLLLVQLPKTAVPGPLGVSPRRYRLQPAFAIADGRGASPTSPSTRRDGLVSSIDFAPTILEWVGVEAPDRMRGQAIESGAQLAPARLDELRRRWASMRDGRQAASFTMIVTLAAIVFLLIGTWRGIRAATRPALRIGALGLLWWPSTVLLGAAVEPATRANEILLIAGSAIVLAVITERLLPWARAPIAPAVACLAAYSVDLAFGGPLLTISALGPSVGIGSRFYGVSNELEPILPIVLLIGLAALTTGREVTRGTLALYAGTGLALLVVVGWGRLGADVGGVLTVGAAIAAAALAMLPGAITGRRLLLAALVPVGALALLIAIDLGLSGGSHLTRNLLRADDPAELWELVTRRYELAWGILTTGSKAAVFLGAVLAVAFAWRNRDRLFFALPHRGWSAALIGGLAAGVVGALVNDSGPVLFINAVVCLAGLTAYLLGRPELDRRPERPGAGRSTDLAPAGRQPTGLRGPA